ncbi:MAG: metallophosphoesterase [Bacteroidota bacterium]
MNKLGFLVVFIFYAGINSYLFMRMWQALPDSGVLQVVFSIVFIISSLSFPVAMIFGNRIPPGLSAVTENIGAYWIIGLFYFVVAALFADLIRIADHFFHFFPPALSAHILTVKFIYLLSVVGLFGLFSVIGYFRFSHPSVRQFTLEIPKGDMLVGNLNLAVASDVHLGNVIRKGRLKKYVALLNRQDADVILFAGDLVDHSMRPVEVQKMDEELRTLKARYGVYAVFGNHEYYGNVARAIDFYARSGIILLRDTAVTVDNRFVLIGRDDISRRHRKPLQEILTGIDRNLPLILLDHHPFRLDDAQNNDIDLQISGHTHDGQFFPLNYLVRKMFPLGYGYKKEGNTHYYVSSGLGLWAAPIRIGTRSEIVLITIQSK